MDIMRGQLLRREAMLDEQRALFHKELLRQRERLMQASRLGAAYVPDEGNVFSDEAWAGAGANAGDSAAPDEASLRKKIAAKLMEQLSAKFAEDRKKL